MRGRKRCIPQFAFYDKAGIQAYLEKQAQAGWMLEKISFGWLFRKAAPKKIHFFVAYYPKKSVFEGEDSGEQRFFWDLCEHAGWRLVTKNEQMQIFCNEEESPVPIETDAALEVEKIHRSAKKSFLLTYFLLLVTFLMQSASFVRELRRNPVDVLGDNVLLCMMPAMALLGAYVIREIVRYFLWHRKAKKMAEEEGVFAGTKRIGNIWSILPFLAMAFILLEMFFLSNGGMARAILGLAVMLAGVTGLSVGVLRAMQRRNVPAAVNRILFLVLTAAGCIALTAGLFMLVLRGGIASGKEPVRTYEYGGWTYEVYRDDLPLTLESLRGVEEGSYGDGYSCELTETESLFLVQTEGVQDPLPGTGDAPWLRYSVTEIKWPILYGWCRDRLLENYDHVQEDRGEMTYHTLRATDAGTWGAEEAYRLYIGEEAENAYVLCFGDRIVELNAEWELTEEQMGIAGEKLGGDRDMP